MSELVPRPGTWNSPGQAPPPFQRDDRYNSYRAPYPQRRTPYYSISEHWGQIEPISGIGKRPPAVVEQNERPASANHQSYPYRSVSDQQRAYEPRQVAVRRAEFPAQPSVRRDPEPMARYNDRRDYDMRRDQRFPGDWRDNEMQQRQPSRFGWQQEDTRREDPRRIEDQRRREYFRREPESPISSGAFDSGFDDIRPPKLDDKVPPVRTQRKTPRNLLDSMDTPAPPPPPPVSPRPEPQQPKRPPKFTPFSAVVKQKEEPKPVEPEEQKAEEFLKKYFTPACDPIIDPLDPVFPSSLSPHVLKAIKASPEFAAAFVPHGWEDPPERLTNEICQYTLSEYGEPGVPFSDYIVANKDDYFYYTADPFTGDRIPTEEEKYIKLITRYDVQDGRDITEKLRAKTT